jgi:hypothetical protein
MEKYLHSFRQYRSIFTLARLVSTYFYRKTGQAFVASSMNAMVVSWLVVAGQVTHFA